MWGANALRSLWGVGHVTWVRVVGWRKTGLPEPARLYLGHSLDRKFLIARFWHSASGFWRGGSARKAWLLVAMLIATVLLQLLVQYRLNFWSRDFFNAIEQKNESLLWTQTSGFLPLAVASLALAILSVWARMTMQREWRRWLSSHLYDYWLQRDLHIRLKFTSGDHQTPEYRIAEDARLATDLPIDLAVGLLSSVLTAAVFVSVLQSVGGSLDVKVFGVELTIPGYLVIAVLLYSIVLTGATLVIGRRLMRVIEENKGAEAELRATGARLRTIGEGVPNAMSSKDDRRAIGVALDFVMAQWRALCWQLMRMTLVSHVNQLVAPSIALLLCTPKYLAGTISLGAMVQLAAAFVVVQGAFNWPADQYGRLAEWASSARRVSTLLVSLDRIVGGWMQESDPVRQEPAFDRLPKSSADEVQRDDILASGTSRRHLRADMPRM